jgi:hypothetical protein
MWIAQKRKVSLAWITGQSNKFTHHWIHYGCNRMHIIIAACFWKGFTNLRKQRPNILNMIAFSIYVQFVLACDSFQKRLSSPFPYRTSSKIIFVTGSELSLKNPSRFHFIVHRVECEAWGKNVQNKRTHHPKRDSHIFRMDLELEIFENENFQPRAKQANVPWESIESSRSPQTWLPFDIEPRVFGIRLGEKYRKEEANEKTTQSQIALSSSANPWGIFPLKHMKFSFSF